MADGTNLSALMKKALPPPFLEAIQTAGGIARERRERLYLVGGVVRDFLLGRTNLDLDLVVEGDAPALSQELAKALSAKVVIHHRFGTAKLHLKDASLDVAMARTETYPHPGALPRVSPGSIRDDLFRRDFTINAMAIRLDPDAYGDLVDPFGGQADLKAKLIRILHPNSFRDDATRMLRALRYEQRLGFRLEATTEALLCRDVALLNTISGDRLRHELELILKEEHPELVLRRAHELGLLAQLHPGLRGEGWLAEKFEQARLASIHQPPPTGLYLSLFFYPLGPDGVEQLVQRLKLPKSLASTLRDSARIKGLLDKLSNPYLLPSNAYRMLQGTSPEAALAVALASTSPLAQERLLLYRNKWRFVKVQLSGEELQQMGIPPGPEMGTILESLLEAKIDGEVKTGEDEKRLVREWLDKTG